MKKFARAKVLREEYFPCMLSRMREYNDVLQKYIADKGLKNTPQRLRIADVFMTSQGHFSTEEIYGAVCKIDPSVGQATVYRTMKLLCDAGLAREVHFGDGIVRYEPRNTKHHDHLICESCGEALEVVDEKIEELQELLTRRHGFIPTRHVLCLYGICPKCQSKNQRKSYVTS